MAEEIIFTRNRTLTGVQLEIFVSFVVDGQRILKKVPALTVDSAWPGTSKTLKNHLLSIIDVAE